MVISRPMSLNPRKVVAVFMYLLSPGSMQADFGVELSSDFRCKSGSSYVANICNRSNILVLWLDFEEEIRKLEAYEREEYIDFTNRLNRNKIKMIVIKIFLFFFPILSVKLGWKS